MASLSHGQEIVIAAPVEKVFRFVSDLENLPHWVGPLKSCTKSGKGYAATTKLLGQSFDSQLEVVESRDGQVLKYRATAPAPSTWTYQFQPVFGNHTAVKVVHELGNAELLGDRTEEHLRRNLEESLSALKQLMERT
jgi:uncharacterized membrane protein